MSFLRVFGGRCGALLPRVAPDDQSRSSALERSAASARRADAGYFAAVNSYCRDAVAGWSKRAPSARAVVSALLPSQLGLLGRTAHCDEQPVVAEQPMMGEQPRPPSPYDLLIFENMSREFKNVMTQDNYDGFRVEADRQITPNLQASHSLFLGTVMSDVGYLYQIGANYASSDGSQLAMAKIGLDGMVTGRAFAKFGDNVELKASGNSFLRYDTRNAYEAGVDYAGQDWTTSLKGAWQGNGHGAAAVPAARERPPGAGDRAGAHAGDEGVCAASGVGVPIPPRPGPGARGLVRADFDAGPGLLRVRRERLHRLLEQHLPIRVHDAPLAAAAGKRAGEGGAAHVLELLVHAGVGGTGSHAERLEQRAPLEELQHLVVVQKGGPVLEQDVTNALAPEREWKSAGVNQQVGAEVAENLGLAKEVDRVEAGDLERGEDAAEVARAERLGLVERALHEEDEAARRKHLGHGGVDLGAVAVGLLRALDELHVERRLGYGSGERGEAARGGEGKGTQSEAARSSTVRRGRARAEAAAHRSCHAMESRHRGSLRRRREARVWHAAECSHTWDTRHTPRDSTDVVARGDGKAYVVRCKRPVWRRESALWFLGRPGGKQPGAEQSLYDQLYARHLDCADHLCNEESSGVDSSSSADFEYESAVSNDATEASPSAGSEKVTPRKLSDPAMRRKDSEAAPKGKEPVGTRGPPGPAEPWKTSEDEAESDSDVFAGYTDEKTKKKDLWGKTVLGAFNIYARVTGAADPHKKLLAKRDSEADALENLWDDFGPAQGGPGGQDSTVKGVVDSRDGAHVALQKRGFYTVFLRTARAAEKKKHDLYAFKVKFSYKVFYCRRKKDALSAVAGGTSSSKDGNTFVAHYAFGEDSVSFLNEGHLTLSGNSTKILLLYAMEDSPPGGAVQDQLLRLVLGGAAEPQPQPAAAHPLDRQLRQPGDHGAVGVLRDRAAHQRHHGGQRQDRGLLRHDMRLRLGGAAGAVPAQGVLRAGALAAVAEHPGAALQVAALGGLRADIRPHARERVRARVDRDSGHGLHAGQGAAALRAHLGERQAAGPQPLRLPQLHQRPRGIRGDDAGAHVAGGVGLHGAADLRQGADGQLLQEHRVPPGPRGAPGRREAHLDEPVADRVARGERPVGLRVVERGAGHNRAVSVRGHVQGPAGARRGGRGPLGVAAAAQLERRLRHAGGGRAHAAPLRGAPAALPADRAAAGARLQLSRPADAAQHVLQDAAVGEVLLLQGGVDAAADLEGEAAVAGDADEVAGGEAVDALDVEVRRLTCDSEGGGGLAGEELQRQNAEADQVGAVDALEGLRDDGADTQQGGALGGPVARAAGAVLLAGDDDEAGAVGAVALRSVEDAEHLAGREVDGLGALVGAEQVREANVGEGAANHDLVVAAARAVGVEVARLHAAGEQKLRGGRGLGDVAGGRNVVSGDGVAEQQEHAGLGDGGLQGSAHVVEVGRVVNVGGGGVPGIKLGLGGLERAPRLAAVGDVGVDLLEELRLEELLLERGHALLGGEQVAQEYGLAGLGADAERLLDEVDVDAAGEGVGDDERGRGEEVGASEGVHAALEVAVAREHGAGHQAVLRDALRDLGVQLAAVADAGHAAVTGDVEAELLEGVDEPAELEVARDGLGAGGKGGLDVGGDLEAVLDGGLGEHARGQHDAGVAGVGAGGDAGDDDGAVVELVVAALVGEGGGARGGLDAVALGVLGREQLTELLLDGGDQDVVLGALGAGDRRTQGAQVEADHGGVLDAAGVADAGVEEFDLLGGAAGLGEVVERQAVDGEEAHGGAVLGGHMLNALADEFDELADHAGAGAEDGRDGEDDVGGKHVVGGLAHELEADHLRQHHGNGLAEHGGLGLDAADAPAEHAQAVDHGGVGVGPDDGVGVEQAVAVKDGASEELQVYL
ncbi:mitochondrial import receptor subunit Tom40 [Babesia caballi]|uniref:Mitochondrial import receptor subunit Tom40 n=1 Tax=Babesia caballi TaxID=5871 RepID=A0AAV4LVJ7_BABCB|nr:mitochondrial import receptor subunit Tom40 [Babesia caballi]